MVIAKLQLLYFFVYIINCFLSPVGWRVLHSVLSLAIGYSLYNQCLKVILFQFSYLMGLELIVNIYVFRFNNSHKLGKEILEEIKGLINMEKLKNKV